MPRINIAKDYTSTPGGRYIAEGPFSGEDFREKILRGKMQEALNNGEKLIIDLDGCYGYPSSFINEAFGGLTKYYAPEEIKNTIEFVSLDQPTLIKDIMDSIGCFMQ